MQGDQGDIALHQVVRPDRVVLLVRRAAPDIRHPPALAVAEPAPVPLVIDAGHGIGEGDADALGMLLQQVGPELVKEDAEDVPVHQQVVVLRLVHKLVAPARDAAGAHGIGYALAQRDRLLIGRQRRSGQGGRGRRHRLCGG